MKIRPKKAVIGTAACLCCGRDIPVKQNEHGTLDHSCQWCDLPMYAKEGTEAHRLLMARVTKFEAGPIAQPVADSVPGAPDVVVSEKPAKVATRGVFDMLAGRA
ncbi:hypothetical protein M3A49_40780 [Paraburkholderia sp. CNPSo 3076]|uniref:hypothetical protein n=1 Tax=Paraburkholderia sp. CNPSo 3076 TaxID=2940936 RepID=UPI00224DE1E4|nr:hypothetical protein [Paraburkholderia sp. CNPSo 3076]MCX5545683.1 hypothetical protein [Paraburkholderia sp. CNPSo 3076]